MCGNAITLKMHRAHVPVYCERGDLFLCCVNGFTASYQPIVSSHNDHSKKDYAYSLDGHFVYEIISKEVLNMQSNKKNSCWIFLSHSSSDIEKIRMIRNEFEACGHNPLAFHLKCLNDSTPGGKQELWDLIFREIDSRDWFVFCESKASLESPNVAKERAHIIDVGKKFVWSIDLSMTDDQIKKAVHKVCSDIRVFISGTRKDLCLFGDRIIKTLQDADYDVWDESSLNLGESFLEQIRNAIIEYGNAGVCLVFLTKNYLSSQYCMSELNYIVASGLNCIALVFEDVELPECILTHQCFRIPHIPNENDAILIKELLDSILQIEIKGAIKFDSQVYDKLVEINERLNYTHRYHSMDPILIKNLGATDDYAEIWRFPCCGKTIRTGNKVPSRSRADGCKCDE